MTNFTHQKVFGNVKMFFYDLISNHLGLAKSSFYKQNPDS